MERIACLCEVYELVELEGLVATRGCHGSRHVKLTRNLGDKCWIAVVFAIPAPHTTVTKCRRPSSTAQEMQLHCNDVELLIQKFCCFHPCSICQSCRDGKIPLSAACPGPL